MTRKAAAVPRPAAGRTPRPDRSPPMPLHSDEPPPRASLLRCEHLDEPLGIDVAAPAFGWTPSGPQRAYQVLVAPDPELPPAGVGTVWDSGRVGPEERTGASHRGAPPT